MCVNGLAETGQRNAAPSDTGVKAKNQSFFPEVKSLFLRGTSASVNVWTETPMSFELSPTHRQRPRFGRIPAALLYSGASRSGLYEWAAEYPGLFRKNGAATLVDFDVLDTILDGLPVAQIGTPASRKPSAA